MRPLKTSQRVLTWFCAYPADESTSSRQKLAHMFCFLSVLLGVICNLTAGAAYFLKYVSEDLDHSLYAFAQIFAVSSSVYIITTSPFLHRRNVAVIDGLAKIYTECKYIEIDLKQQFIYFR